MTDCLEQKDMQGFAVDVHGLKSSLAGVGAMELSELAQRLEMAAKEADAAFCRQHFPALEQHIEELYDKLALIGREPEAAPDGELGDIVALKLRLAVVRDLLDRFEGDEALEVLRELGKTNYGEEWGGLLRELMILTEEFEFDKALALIDAER